MGAIYFLLGLLGFFFLGDVTASLAGHSAALFVLGAVAVGCTEIDFLSLYWPDNILHGVTALVGLAIAAGGVHRPDRATSPATPGAEG